LLIEGDGQKAAVADAIYRINENVKIVSAPRNWRQYLERSWGSVEDPPEILRPKDAEERAVWRELVKKGWDEGYEQADEVFDQDLNRLSADFAGMVRYRQLLAQGMVSPPFAQQVDRGVTGEDATMRVGDRAVVITGVPQLITESGRWQPANR
jgi:defect-in-organelle-trafficking protein DotC